MIPRTLTEWTTDVVVDMLTKSLFETDHYDNKQELPHPQDHAAKERLRRTCCAFANSDGGFIVFGISDDRTLPAEDRLVGLEKTQDFPQQFGNYPRKCVPSIEWNFLNPPLSLPSSKVLHVVEIPKSWKAPHATGDHDRGWRFTKRTNQGNEGMTIEEVRSGFLGLYEKRLKLQLLHAELAVLKQNAQSAYITGAEIEDQYSLVSLDVHVIESILADTYSITASDSELLQALAQIRQVTRVANNKIQLFFSIVGVPMTHKKALVREHNMFMEPKCAELASLCDIATTRLEILLRT